MSLLRALKAWGVSMLSDQEFNDWCHYVNLPQSARQVISQIRDSQPIRRVKSSGINVRGDYASRKMGKTIQFESHLVELPRVEEYEEDPDVLEYYDQLNVYFDKRYLSIEKIVGIETPQINPFNVSSANNPTGRIATIDITYLDETLRIGRGGDGS